MQEVQKALSDLMKDRDRANLGLPGRLAEAEIALGRLRIRQGRADEGRARIASGVARLESAVKARPDDHRDNRALAAARLVAPGG